MYQRILVPVDGSNTSDSALREAIQSVVALGKLAKNSEILGPCREFGQGRQRFPPPDD